MSNHIDNPREIRRQLGLNQHEFWSRIGVTQSGGSRYESGRNMPRPVQELLRVVHLEQISLEELNKEDLQVIRFLKEHKPELLETFRKAVQERDKPAQRYPAPRMLAG